MPLRLNSVSISVGLALALVAHVQTAPQRSLGTTGTPGRRALVVGNRAYRSKPLRTGLDDARTVAKALQEDQFTVDLLLDADARQFEQEVDRFASSLAKDDVAVIYYSGYATPIANENYLLPVDFGAKNAVDAKYSSYAAERLIDRVESTDARLCVLIIDAAWDNGLAIDGSIKRGLAPIGAAKKTFVAASAAPGSASVDISDSRNGVFAGFLSDALRTPGLTLDQLFTQVRSKVYEATAGAQVPVVSASADSSFVIRISGNQAGELGKPSFETEWKRWQAVKDKHDSHLLSSFLTQFPDGSFHETATAELQSAFAKAPGSVSNVPAQAVQSSEPSSMTSIDRMARIRKREVDPNFAFGDADFELLQQCEAIDGRFGREGMIFNDPELQEYVDRVGRSILPSTTAPPNVTWRFMVIRDPVPNAFALPDGSVYVNTGLLAVLDDESQLASVLAHEITHVTGRHGYMANRSYRKKALTVSLVEMGAAYTTGNNYVSASMRLAASLLPSIMQASIMGYQRELEREADLYALDKLSNTGYDPREMANAFRRLEDSSEVELQTVYYNDHPKLQDRIEYVNNYLANKKIINSDLFPAQAATYREKTEAALREDVQLAILSGRRRTALAVASKLQQSNPSSPDNLIALADAYRALGPWTPKPEAGELSKHAKKQLAKQKARLTPAEQEAAYAESDEGHAQLLENAKDADGFYKKALDLDPHRVVVFKSLGRLYESTGDFARARSMYEKYVATATDVDDVERVKSRLSTLDSGLKVRDSKKKKD